MAAALEATGWMKAEQHFNAACAATMARDDATYEREMAAFKAISSGWETSREAAQQGPERGNQTRSGAIK
jgi:hypothetical protein